MDTGRNLRTRDVNLSYKETATYNRSATKQIGIKNKKESSVPKNSSQPTTTLTEATTDRKSLTTRASISSNNSLPAANSRLSASRNLNPSSASQNNLLSEIISSLESRIKSIEDNTIQDSRFTSIHSLIQLRSQITEVQLTIERLKSDIEGLQFVTAQLCELDVKFNESEESCNRLSTENAEFKSTISELKKEVVELRLELKQIDNRQQINKDEHLHKEAFDLKEQIHQFKEVQLLIEKGVSIEQQHINSNIVIRGLELPENASQADLLEVYNQIRSYLGIAGLRDFDAIGVNILQSRHSISISSKSTTAKTIQVQLGSVLAKRQFLQIRRSKKDILPTDISITQKSKRPILTTEQLTIHNQELLFNARSLRTTNNYKFVWSNNGQILARLRPGTKVIRIKDKNHINQLKSEQPPKHV